MKVLHPLFRDNAKSIVADLKQIEDSSRKINPAKLSGPYEYLLFIGLFFCVHNIVAFLYFSFVIDSLDNVHLLNSMETVGFARFVVERFVRPASADIIVCQFMDFDVCRKETEIGPASGTHQPSDSTTSR